MKTFKYLIAALALALFSPFAATAADYCADVNGTQYTSLAAAISAASEGQTVKLIADTTENVTIDKNLTLDLNGCELNGGTKPATATLKVTAKVTILDSSTAQTGTIKRNDTAENSKVTSYSAYYVIDIQGGNAALTFESGNVINNSGTIPPANRQGASLVRVGSDANPDATPTFVIKGGNFTQNNFPAIKVDYGTFYLKGGTITCENDEAVKNWKDAYIQGGTIKGTVGSWTSTDSACSSTLEISGGEIDGNVYAMMYEKEGVVTKTATINITGGKVTGNLGTYKGKSVREGATTTVDASTTTIAVSGGEFSSAVDAKYCASGYMPQYNESDSTYGVADGIQVLDSDSASVVGSYNSLATAIANAVAGQTIKLLANVKENVTIDKNLTLDLNGFTINGGTVKATPTLTVKANVTVKDSSEDKKGTIMREDTADNSDGSGRTSHYVIDIQGKDAFLTFESGNVINDSGTIPPANRQGASLVRVGNDGDQSAKPTLIIKGGNFKQDNFPAIKVDYGTFYLKGGTITCANDEAVKNWKDAYIQGGKIKGTVGSWTSTDSVCSSTLEISGGEIDGNVYAMVYDKEGVVTKTATINITGGKVTGNLGTYKGKSVRKDATTAVDESTTTIAVSGGTFNNAVDAKYCASGYMPEYNESTSTYGVADGIQVLKADGVSIAGSYNSLATAIVNAEAGQTIKLLANVKENVTIAKNLTLDLNGCTINGGTKPATAALKVTANVTVKDSSDEQTGTLKREDTADNSRVDSYSAYYVIDIQGENAALTFESGNVINNSGTIPPANRQGASLVRVGNDGNPSAEPSFIIKGGYFKQDNFPAIKVDYGTFTLEDGTIICANDEAVKNWKDAYIKGGKITGTVGSWTSVDSVCSSTLEISGGEIDGNVYAMMYDKEGVVTKTATINITGGKVTGNLGTYKGKSVREDATKAVDASTTTIAVSGGEFKEAVEAKYCASGYMPQYNESTGKYGVTDAIQVIAADKTTTYHSLAEASAAATAGQTIKLLTDFANTDYTVDNVIDIKLAKGVTLDGNDKTLSGNIKVTVDAAGDVTIKNVNFKDIHNAQALSDSQKEQYAFPEGKVGTLSAVYAKNLKGKLTVSGCEFENCDWDGMQITPAEGAEVEIRDNIFKEPKGSEVVKGQLRYVHVEMYYGTPNQMGTAITLTMTDNQFFGEPVDSSCGIYWMNSASTLDLTGNYFEYPNTASVTLADKGEDGKLVYVNHCEMIYPARSEATVDEDNLSFVAVVVKDIYLVTAYDSLAAAISAAEEGQTVKLIANTDENVTIAKNLTLDLNGYTLNGGTKAATPTLTVKANVTVKDSSEKQTGTLKRDDTAANSDGSGRTSHYVIDIQGKDASGKDACLTFESGKVFNNSGTIPPANRQGASLVRVGNDGDQSAKPTLIIKGGTFTQNNFTVIKVDYGTFYLQGGVINCKIDEAVKNWATTYIQGGTVNGTVASWVYGKGIDSSTLEISGGTINGNVYAMTEDGAEGKMSVVSITGGTVTGELGTYQGKNIRDDNKKEVTDISKTTIAVSGGTFEKEVAQKYCAAGYRPEKNTDGKYGIVNAIELIAADGATTTYHSLAEAFAAATAQSGATVKLLADVTETNAKDAAVSYVMTGVTFDLNEHTYSHYDNAHTFQGTDGTIKNGKMVCLSDGAYALSIGSDSVKTTSFTVEDVEVTGGINISYATGVVLTNLTVTGTQDYAVWAEGDASVTINGGTYTAGAKAVFSGYSDASITVEDGTFIANDVALVDIEVGDGKSPVVLSISGGTFDKEVAQEYCKEGYCCEKNEDDDYYSVLKSWDSALDGETLAAFSYSGIYDGEEHSISITADSAAFEDIEGVEVTYKETEDGDYGAENPAYKNACTKTVYYRVQAPGYATYKGSATVEIKQKALTESMFSLSEDSYTWDGTAKEPEVKVTDEESALISDEDFTIAYSGNIDVSTDTTPAKVTITAKEEGNYTGSVTLTFTIGELYADVTFDALGGKIGTESSVVKQQARREYNNMPDAPTRENYTFIGWYSGVTNGATKVEANAAWLVEGDHTLYAQWKINDSALPSAADAFDCDDNEDGTVTIKGFDNISIPESGALVIPDTIDGKPVTAIAKGAFANSTENITSITLPMFLETIGNWAFGGIDSLTNVTFQSVRKWNDPSQAGQLIIGSYAFSSLGLESVTLPVEVKKVGSYAFANCQKLSSVTILGTETEFGQYPFRRTKVSNTAMTVHLAPALASDTSYMNSLSAEANVAAVRTDAIVESVAPMGVSIGDDGSVELPVSVGRASNWGAVDATRIRVEYSENLTDTPTTLVPEVKSNDGDTLSISVTPPKKASSGFFRVKVIK